jgi:hypothetical protein
MSGYFADLVIGWRISQCGKQVVSDLQGLSQDQGAHLALMVALFRATILDVPVPGSSITINEVVQHPTAFRKELSYAAFSLLQAIREESREKIRSYEAFNIIPDPIVVEHTEMCDLALSLLMSTVGVGGKSSTLGVVKYAWEEVKAYSPSDADIALVMTMPEYIVDDIIRQPLETDRWLALARTVPEFMRQEV